MKIIVDENIPFGREYFGSLGEVTQVSGRNITREILKSATALIVRSITPVNETLLEGSNIQFVGSTTTGIDHIDVPYLEKKGIGFSAAIGANANSVAEYVLTAILTEIQKRGLRPHTTTVGIVGVGNIGTLVAQKAQGLGMTTLLHDPPRAFATGEPNFLPFEALVGADFLTLHVPITYEGPYSTFHLFDQARLSQLSTQTTLINTSRGAVVDSQALLKAIKKKLLFPPIIDVWENEPTISWELLTRVAIGTPHIAGHSFDGKILGAQQVFQAACDFFNGLSSHPFIPEIQDEDTPSIFIDAKGKAPEEIFCELATQAYFLLDDHTRLQNLLQIPLEHRAQKFDDLRKSYPKRREFQSHHVVLVNGTSTLKDQIKALRFSVQ